MNPPSQQDAAKNNNNDAAVSGRAYRRTLEVLHDASSLASELSSVPSLVSLRDVIEDPPPSLDSKHNNDNNTSNNNTTTQLPPIHNDYSRTTTSRRVPLFSSVHHQYTHTTTALELALEHLEQVQPQPLLELSLDLESTVIQDLTAIVTDQPQPNLEAAQQTLLDLGKSIPRRVCQHPFRRNDIVWVCRTCQADETCVLCHACFSQSNHEGHDVAFYHAQAGGCCDCGDPDAWDAAGFCPHHGPLARNQQDDDKLLPPDTCRRVRGLVPAVADWLVSVVAPMAVEAHARVIKGGEANKKSKKKKHKTSRDMTLRHGQMARGEEEEILRLLLPRPLIGGDDDDEDVEIVDSDVDDDDDNNNTEEGEEDVVMMEEDRDLSLRPAVAISQDTTQDTTDNENSANFDFDPVLVDMGHVFVPGAASTSKSRHGVAASSAASSRSETLAEQLGKLGREQHGLYLILHADDIHTLEQLKDALRELTDDRPSFYAEPVLIGLAKALRLYGELVVWGTTELVAECSNTQVHCWLDGDRVASGAVGAVMLRRAAKLAETHGMNCSIVTRRELQWQQRAVAVAQWLTHVARSCDPLCQTVAASVLPQEHLVPLLKADFHLGASFQKAWHALLLTLLAVPTFKRNLAASYCDTYQYVTSEYARGMGLNERSGYSLSVQFLNRVTYVVGLVAGRNLLEHLGKALLETLKVAAFALDESGRRLRLSPEHFVLAHRRYSPCICDLKCVLNVKGMARLFASRAGTFMDDWLRSLGLAQLMDEQVWRTFPQGHVEVEPRGWVGAFNASISLGSLFERLLSWDDDDPSPIDASQSVLAVQLVSGTDLSFYVLTQGVSKWQVEEMKYHVSVRGRSSHQCPASLPFSTVAAAHGTTLAWDALPVAQVTPWSFHLPLHRFATTCLREVCRRPVEIGMEVLLERLWTQLPYDVHAALFRGLMEFPLLILSRAAQVQAGLWRRNGAAMRDQVLNYAEPPFCRSLRDADILLVQFATLGRRSRDGQHTGCSVLVHLLLHRLGLFEFLGFANAPESNVPKYSEEVEAGLYPKEDPPEGTFDSELPWSYSPAVDVEAFLWLLEELLHLLIVITTELPPLPPKSKADHTKQAKERLRREVVHRLASGPKTHSELSEVHHVLSHWDNTFLSEEGKLLNPDDASGAALGQALADVATQQVSGRMKPSPEKWELNRSAWSDYDPAFFHIGVRSHQLAAEQRPKPKTTSSLFGIEARPYAPLFKTSAHPTFLRLRRDVTADAAVIAIVYRTLHMHCRARPKEGEGPALDSPYLRGPLAYDTNALSETALGRAIHLLTLGASAWEDSPAYAPPEQRGGTSVGSVFTNNAENHSLSPTAGDWVKLTLLSDPYLLMDCEWYRGDENALLLLRRLAMDGGKSGVFVAQDEAVRAGAAWLCEFAAKVNPEASALIRETTGRTDTKHGRAGELELKRKQREAQERMMQKMKAEAAKFAEMMQLEEEEEEDGAEKQQYAEDSSGGESSLLHRRPMSRSSTMESDQSGSNVSTTRSPQRGDLGIPQFFSMYSSGGEATMDADEDQIPDRLLKQRPVCIICSEEIAADREPECGTRSDEDDEKRKRSRRKKERNNALAFVGYAQPSVVLKGGGGPPPFWDDNSPIATVRRFTATHVGLCSHAVHSECCESYLASILQREDRLPGRREEFHCPACKRLSNCLVPFIDVGVDWTDVPNAVSSGRTSEIPNQASMQVDEKTEASEAEIFRHSLHDFLSTSPWWVGRNDKSIAWNGQCAFISLHSSVDEDAGDEESSAMEVDPSPTKTRRLRRVRPLRKRDLYIAWNAMMKTPRFMRRRRNRLRSNLALADDSPSPAGGPNEPARWALHDESSSGETVVWRKFMDLLSDMAYRADVKRLGERRLLQNCGEFRHYHAEKIAYNIANRSAGKETVEWPACMTRTALPDVKRQELSREKLLSKLLKSIESFTYSVCCESHEARRLLCRETESDTVSDATGHGDGDIPTILFKYGVRGVSCRGCLVVMPPPAPLEGEGSQPFAGRLGKLRHFGLSVMAAAGAVSADLVQLVLCLPIEVDNVDQDCKGSGLMDIDKALRAPVVFPILLGHVLTHVVAAMCAACGWARARSDSLELAWPVPFSSRGSFHSGLNEQYVNDAGVDAVTRDCEGFMKLGFLARILQVLLSKMGVDVGADSKSNDLLAGMLASVASFDGLTGSPGTKAWYQACLLLLQKAFTREYLAGDNKGVDVGVVDHDMLEQFFDACASAAHAAICFLADVGIILQILVPGVAAKYRNSVGAFVTYKLGNVLSESLAVLTMLHESLGLEPLEVMMRSSLVHDVVYHWLENARSHARNGDPEQSTVFLDRQIRQRLFRTEGFRQFDWPLADTRPYIDIDLDKKMPASESTAKVIEVAASGTARMRSSSQAGPLVVFSSKKQVPLLGGYMEETSVPPNEFAIPRITMLPTSYTDLYAELGSLYPDCEQTAICMICGEVLNAGGKGECTHHSYKCGAGSCIFFLLQECLCLLMHGGKAVYEHSPYVDSHGETPQYRGRPLNLDMDRYNALKEMWSGHTLRQRVINERANARQQIIADFY